MDTARIAALDRASQTTLEQRADRSTGPATLCACGEILDRCITLCTACHADLQIIPIGTIRRLQKANDYFATTNTPTEKVKEDGAASGSQQKQKSRKLAQQNAKKKLAKEEDKTPLNTFCKTCLNIHCCCDPVPTDIVDPRERATRLRYHSQQEQKRLDRHRKLWDSDAAYRKNHGKKGGSRACRYELSCVPWEVSSPNDTPSDDPSTYDLDVLEKTMRFVCRAYQKLDTFFADEDEQDKKCLNTLMAANTAQHIVDRFRKAMIHRADTRRSLFMTTMIPKCYSIYHQLLRRPDYNWKKFVNSWKQEEQPFVDDLGFTDDERPTNTGAPGSRRYPPASATQLGKIHCEQLQKLRTKLTQQRTERLKTACQAAITACKSMIALTDELAKLSITDKTKEIVDAFGLAPSRLSRRETTQQILASAKRGQENAADTQAREADYKLLKNEQPDTNASASSSTTTQKEPQNVKTRWARRVYPDPNNYPSLDEVVAADKRGTPIGTQYGQPSQTSQDNKKDWNNTWNPEKADFAQGQGFNILAWKESMVNAIREWQRSCLWGRHAWNDWCEARTTTGTGFAWKDP
ncbi:MAG: hypothetical protein NZ777_13890, partial [Pseudomonadales bacterium]|nr:hypothetical protein [Pseudomonadales bacterium]